MRSLGALVLGWLVVTGCSSDEGADSSGGGADVVSPMADGLGADVVQPPGDVGGIDSSDTGLPEPTDVEGDAVGDVVGDIAEDIREDITAPPFDPLPLVDPFVGTGASGFNYGATPPGPALPFSMVRLSPDTGDAKANTFGVGHAGGYRYEDPYLLGFSHLHLVGVGIGDQGNLLAMPVRGPAAERTVWSEYRADLSHDTEVAEPGYYRIDLPDRDVVAELTATRRVGVHRYTFGNGEGAPGVVIDLGSMIGSGEITASDIEVDAATGAFSGSLRSVGDFSKRFGGFTLYFAGRLSSPPKAVHTFKDGPRPPSTERPIFQADVASVSGVRTGAVLEVDSGTVELFVALSFVDVAGAKAALAAETPEGTHFDDVRAAAQAVWTEHLGRVEVSGGTQTRTKILYTSLYHLLLMPTLMTDVDGRYRGIDQQVHTADGFTYYSDLSLWDTYRTFHPLVSLLYPEYQRDFLLSLGAMAEAWGGLPRWPLAIGEGGSMIGTSADIVFGDAQLAGGSPVSAATIWPYVRQTAFGPHPQGKTGKDSIAQYMSLGYCPADETSGSVSKTLEYATDDACGAVLAEAAGAVDDAATLKARSGSWRNHLDEAEGYLAPRLADGSIPKYTPTDHSGYYVEGSAWQYTFMVPQDVPGLVSALGKERFLERLYGLMEGTYADFQPLLPTGYYWHGNEPNLVAPFLFGHAGRMDLTGWWVAWVADNLYTMEPGGLAGNDDGGTLSAWYVFAAAGIYPLSCTGEFALSSPLFERVTWHLPEGLGRPAATLEFSADAPFEEELALPNWNGNTPLGATVSVKTLLGGGHLMLPAALTTGSPPGL